MRRALDSQKGDELQEGIEWSGGCAEAGNTSNRRGGLEWAVERQASMKAPISLEGTK